MVNIILTRFYIRKLLSNYYKIPDGFYPSTLLMLYLICISKLLFFHLIIKNIVLNHNLMTKQLMLEYINFEFIKRISAMISHFFLKASMFPPLSLISVFLPTWEY